MRKGHFTHEEKEVFTFFNRHQEISSFSALAITGCECDTTEMRAELVKEFEVGETTWVIPCQINTEKSLPSPI